MNKTTNILILGKNGQIGHALSNMDWGENVNIVSLGRQDLDITNEAEVKRILSYSSWDFIINAVAYRDVEKAETEKELCYKINVTAVETLANICAQNNIPIFHYSTDYVFDGKSQGPYVEDATVNPINYYGQTKEISERVIRKHSPQHLILRVCWVYGLHGHNFLKRIWDQCYQQKDFYFPNDQKGAPTLASDIAKVTLVIIKKILKTPDFPLWGTYHYGSAPVTTWYDVGSKIIDFYNTTLNPLEKRQAFSLSLKDARTRFNLKAERPIYSYLNCEKIEKTFSIRINSWIERLSETMIQFEKGNK